ncbi:hypothetical protein [Streptomyces iconiensis]|uniref:YD repeat-containing protein n=1 Tax=Streptomyces iconiensis TaxID=1384038 RepID=A0ABT7A1L7_9ACTN|nr:hypothetical protein [Streptomyces iconiensis]MDJ1135230.1 hypothetical protein [Streptomyces iconiensis]
MRSEETTFSGGPMDGRTLPVLLGPTGRPPRDYEIPILDGNGDPDGERDGASGGRAAVHLYRLEPSAVNKLGLPRGWKYVYEGEGRPSGGFLSRLPWRRPR